MKTEQIKVLKKNENNDKGAVRNQKIKNRKKCSSFFWLNHEEEEEKEEENSNFKLDVKWNTVLIMR